MALTQDFKGTIVARVKRDPAFRKALFKEAIESFLAGEVGTGKIILRDFINATIGFNHLAQATKRSSKSLMRMLGPTGNPQAHNLFEIVAYIQKVEGIHLQVRLTRRPPSWASFFKLRDETPGLKDFMADRGDGPAQERDLF